MSSSDCPRKGKWIGGCRFEGRWEKSEPIFPANLTKVTGSIIDDFRRKTYVLDICTTCGRTIEREKA